LQLQYTDAKDKTSQRVVWPLAMFFWGGVWSIAAWCETRSDFRSFRLDRIQDFQIDKKYPDQSGRRLSDFNRAIRKKSSAS
jgi:predicted DNA-binding transcriptional regulator YafY